MTRAKRLGIWGGTFDPIHQGHVQMANEARQALALEQLFMLPVNVPPHRAKPTASEHRLNMLALALETYPALSVDAREVQREGMSYSVLSCREYRQENPSATIFWCMGSDAFLHFHTWKNYREILALVNVAVIVRPPNGLAEVNNYIEQHQFEQIDASAAAMAGSVICLRLNQIDISSSQLRASLQHCVTSTLISPAVGQYIQQHKLYIL